MDAVVKYIDGLLEKSTPDAPYGTLKRLSRALSQSGTILMAVWLKQFFRCMT